MLSITLVNVSLLQQVSNPVRHPQGWVDWSVKSLGWFYSSKCRRCSCQRHLGAVFLVCLGLQGWKLVHIHIMVVIILLPSKTTAIHSSWEPPRKIVRTLCPIISEVEPRKIWGPPGFATSWVRHMGVWSPSIFRAVSSAHTRSHISQSVFLWALITEILQKN